MSDLEVKKEKKPFFKRKGGMIFIVIMVVLIAGAISTFALRNQITRGILGPAKYYLVKEGLAINNVTTEDYSLDGDLTLGEDYGSILVFTEAEKTNIDLNVQCSNSQGKMKLDMNLLGLIDLELKSQGDLLSFCFNGGDEVVTTTKADKKSSDSKKSSSKSKTKVEKMSTWDKAVWLFDFINSPVFDEIESCVKTAEAEYKGSTCTVDTYTFTGKNQSAILNALADKLDKDEGTQRIYKEEIASLLTGVGLLSSNDPTEMANSIRNLAEECYDSKGSFEYIVYYDGGDIVNREYKTSDNTMSLGTYNKNDENHLSFSYNSIKGDFVVSDTSDVSDVNLKKEDVKSAGDLLGDLDGLLGGLLGN